MVTQPVTLSDLNFMQMTLQDLMEATNGEGYEILDEPWANNISMCLSITERLIDGYAGSK